MSKNRISNVCDRCGKEANRLTCLKKFGHEPWKDKYIASTYHKGKCDICGEIKGVTSPRDFFNPDFSLLFEERKKQNESST